MTGPSGGACTILLKSAATRWAAQPAKIWAAIEAGFISIENPGRVGGI